MDDAVGTRQSCVSSDKEEVRKRKKEEKKEREREKKKEKTDRALCFQVCHKHCELWGVKDENLRARGQQELEGIQKPLFDALVVGSVLDFSDVFCRK